MKKFKRYLKFLYRRFIEEEKFVGLIWFYMLTFIAFISIVGNTGEKSTFLLKFFLIYSIPAIVLSLLFLYWVATEAYRKTIKWFRETNTDFKEEENL